MPHTVFLYCARLSFGLFSPSRVQCGRTKAKAACAACGSEVFAVALLQKMFQLRGRGAMAQIPDVFVVTVSRFEELAFCSMLARM